MRGRWAVVHVGERCGRIVRHMAELTWSGGQWAGDLRLGRLSEVEWVEGGWVGFGRRWLACLDSVILKKVHKKFPHMIKKFAIVTPLKLVGKPVVNISESSEFICVASKIV